MREAVTGALGKGKEFEKEGSLKQNTEDFFLQIVSKCLRSVPASLLFWSAPHPILLATLQFCQDKPYINSTLGESLKITPWLLVY